MSSGISTASPHDDYESDAAIDLVCYALAASILPQMRGQRLRAVAGIAAIRSWCSAAFEGNSRVVRGHANILENGVVANTSLLINVAKHLRPNRYDAVL